MRIRKMGPWRAPLVLLMLVAFMATLVPAELVAQSRYDRFIPGADPYKRPDPYDGAGHARLGRTLGGAAGIAAGSFGGAALAAAVIKGAGLAAMGPVVPIIVGTAITAGGAFLGAKLLSSLGQEGDRMLGPGTTWTLVGAIAGSLLGYALIPAMGPFAGPAGRIIAAGVAGLAGGILAKLFAPQLDKVATPRNIYAATGGVIGAVGFGPVGAIAGAVGGYALGAIFGDNFFADQYSSPKDYTRGVGNEVRGITDRFRSFKDTIGDWFGNNTDRFRDRMHDNWNYYDQNSGYYDDYDQSRRDMYDVIGYQQSPYDQGKYYDYDQSPYGGRYSQDPGFNFSYNQGYDQSRSFDFSYDSRSGSLSAAYENYRRSHEEFERYNRSGNERQRYEAYEKLKRSEEEYRRYQGR